MKKVRVLLVALLASATIAAVAQETPELTPTTTNTNVSEVSNEEFGYKGGYNTLSIRPIHKSDIMYQKTIWRKIDLREKQNRPLVSRNREIQKLILNSVMDQNFPEARRVKAYITDSLDREAKLSDVMKTMQKPSDVTYTQEEIDLALANGDSSLLLSMTPEYYSYIDIWKMQIKENLIFDKQRSRMYYDIIALTLMVPADHPANEKNSYDVEIASFSYRELCEKLWKDNPEAIWFNNANDKEHKNLCDAFDLRLFSSYIVKVSNANNEALVEIYQDKKKGIMAAQWAAFDLLEYEHNLWEL